MNVKEEIEVVLIKTFLNQFFFRIFNQYLNENVMHVSGIILGGTDIREGTSKYNLK